MHLELNDAVTVTFSESLESQDQSCIGVYHHGKGKIELLQPDAFEEIQEKSDLWTAIPVEEHFDSIVVHELTHAVFDQANIATHACAADWEYVAYAMQIASLGTATRDDFINSVGVSHPIAIDELNSMTLAFSPSSFAAKSWLHFSQQDNECELIGKLIEGETTLWLEPE